MRLEEREATIQKTIDECDHDQKERSEERIFKKWRVKLEQEPTLLKPFPIDEIVRAVKHRLSNAS